MACCTMLYTVQSEHMIYRSLNFSKRKSRGLGAHDRQLAFPGETVSDLGTPNIQLSSSKRADLPFYYLFGQKFWFWQTFWKVAFAIFIRTRCGSIFCPSIIYLDRNSILTNFFEKFLRSPQLHSQKNRAFVNRIPKYSLFICILKLSHPNVFFFAYCVAIFTPSPNSHRNQKS